MFLSRWQLPRRILLILLVAAVTASVSGMTVKHGAESSAPSSGVSMCLLAYIDPGSGQLVWQMVVAGCLGALFYVKQVRVVIVDTVKKWFKKD